jgi:hypothetical protein
MEKEKKEKTHKRIGINSKGGTEKKKKKEITREAKLGGELPTEQKSFFLSISSIISPRQKTR